MTDGEDSRLVNNIVISNLYIYIERESYLFQAGIFRRFIFNELIKITRKPRDGLKTKLLYS